MSWVFFSSNTNPSGSTTSIFDRIFFAELSTVALVLLCNELCDSSFCRNSVVLKKWWKLRVWDVNKTQLRRCEKNGNENWIENPKKWNEKNDKAEKTQNETEIFQVHTESWAMWAANRHSFVYLLRTPVTVALSCLSPPLFAIPVNGEKKNTNC